MLDPSSLNTLYPWMAFGIASLTLALLGLLARRRKSARPLWEGPVVLAGLLLLLSGVAAVAGYTTLVALPATALAAVWLAFAILRTGVPRSAAVFLLATAARPRVQALFLLLVGGAVIGWQGYLLSRALDKELENSDRFMTTVMESPVLAPASSYTAQTDAGAKIQLWQPAVEMRADDGMQFVRRQNYEVKLIQTGGPDPSYNCHGWVFTGGKAWIRGDSVDQILRENRYREVKKPAPGDVAVYRDRRGDVMHTAMVRGWTADGTLLLESKWGKLSRYIHTAEDHAYNVSVCTYYTTTRGGHVLQTGMTE